MSAQAVRSHAKSDINITPLIDIVLVLLIIFIVMVPTLVKVAPAAIPRHTGDGKPSPEPVVVTLDAQGQCLLQREVVTPAQLRERLAEAFLLQPMNQRKVFLKVDPEMSHGRAVAVMDDIRAASEVAKVRSRVHPSFSGQDGGDARTVVALLKR